MSKDLFIHQIHDVELGGQRYFPTVVHYARDKAHPVVIGHNALEETEENPDLLFRDFKLALGQSAQSEEFCVRAADGSSRTSLQLMQDFFAVVMQNISQWLRSQFPGRSSAIMIAEPLTINGDPVWLANYRRHIKDFLKNAKWRGIENLLFLEVEFLPEPFAVFQYYRYGIKHPAVADRSKHVALVIDFGGGTCDTCVIETTQEGDISQTGRNAKPLGAHSIDVGGFYINQVLAEYLLKKHLASNDKERQAIQEGVRAYGDFRRGRQIRRDKEEFVKNLRALIHRIEQAKLALSKQIHDWSMDANLSAFVHHVLIPRNPYVVDPELCKVPLSASEFRDCYVEKIWKAKLKSAIENTLQNAKKDLNGKAVDLVLLSGGSSNIGWLEKLLHQAFESEISDANILKLPDYQEVVSKGLAVECARRFFNGEDAGDFSTTTYNTLNFMFSTDEHLAQDRKYIPETKGVPRSDIVNVLLPAGFNLRDLIDQPVLWKADGRIPDASRLNYFFLRSGNNPEDLDNRFNVSESRLPVPKTSAVDHRFYVELTVKEDGTARPTFVLHKENNQKRRFSISGEPFALDSTYLHKPARVEAYVGFDFGTSNSAVSFVDQRSVESFQKSPSRTSYGSLSDCAESLPYPLAVELAAYLKVSMEEHARFRVAQQCVEAGLTLASYTAFAEMCTISDKKATHVFKSYTQRSAGPLIALLRSSLQVMGEMANISKPLYELMRDHQETLDNAVKAINDYKHQKGDAVDLLPAVETLCNYLERTFRNWKFGHLENVRKKPLSTAYQGIFRVAHGAGAFLETHSYSGHYEFDSATAIIWNQETGQLLEYPPLFAWLPFAADQQVDLKCHILDFFDQKKSTLSFKLAGMMKSTTMENEMEIRDALVETFKRYIDCDPCMKLHSLK